MALLYSYLDKSAQPPPKYTVCQEIPDDEFVRNWTAYITQEANKHMQKGMGLFGVDRDDLVQLGMLGLSKVPANRRFSTNYVQLAIKNTMMRPWELGQKEKRKNSGVFSLSDDEKDLIVILPDKKVDGEMRRAEARIDIDKLMTVLTAAHRDIVERLLRGESVDEIGERLGKTGAAISRTYRLALKRMQAFAENRPKKKRGKRRS
jgi:RNA polymerase sigma factor (sigma-70 family)